ncbi:MAG: ATP-grasp domain-containing protein [Nitrososphaeraceae archaeon]
MRKPILYVEHLPSKKNRLAFDFCYDAKMGAEQLGIKVKSFGDPLQIPPYPTNIIVGSVESSVKWLEYNNYQIPSLIDLNLFKDFLGRKIWYSNISDITQSNIFIKPANQIKAFTGFVVDDPKFIPLWAENYNGLVLAQEVVDIISEYRLYVHNNKIIGMKHYTGECLSFPNKEFIIACVEHAKTIIKHKSYTLDFGVLRSGDTILIEANDAFAIGNYGIEPYYYYLFIRDRWLQITGIRTNKDDT